MPLMATQTYRASAFLEAATRRNLPMAVGSDETQVLAHLNPSGNLKVNFLDLEAVRRVRPERANLTVCL